MDVFGGKNSRLWNGSPGRKAAILSVILHMVICLPLLCSIIARYFKSVSLVKDAGSLLLLLLLFRPSSSGCVGREALSRVELIPSV